MSIKAVMFDLDGTLLPMDQEEFIQAYFSRLAVKLASHGYKPKDLINAIWAGTQAMVCNDGSKTNEQAFWDCFCGIFGEQARSDETLFRDFYETDFQRVASVCKPAEVAYHMVNFVTQNGFRAILATNPIFPAIATESRIRWAGLQPEQFEIYTTYENCRYCKPHLNYYRDILAQAGLQPEECIMVGNDVGDDMVAAQLGCPVFLLTNCLINTNNEDIRRYPHGSWSDLRLFLHHHFSHG